MVTRLMQPPDTDLLALQILHVAKLGPGVEPEQRTFESRKQHAQVGAAEIGRHSRRWDAGKLDFAAHEREVTQGARHLNEVDIEPFLFVVASVFGGEEYDRRYV